MNFYDVSGLLYSNIFKIFKKDLIKKWIKIIPLNRTIDFNNYNRKNLFIKIAKIELDKNKNRKTLIRFNPTIHKQDFNKKAEWLYIFTINNKIVKIGGTRIGIRGRVISYLSGHYIAERGKSGDCSKTNGYIYNTFEFYLKLGCKINMYGYKLPTKEINVDILNKKTKILMQTYHAYESRFIEDYKNNYKNYPYLSENSDPSYKNNK